LPAGGAGRLFTIHLMPRDKRKHDACPPRSGLASSMNCLRLGAGYLRSLRLIVNLHSGFSTPNG